MNKQSDTILICVCATRQECIYQWVVVSRFSNFTDIETFWRNCPSKSIRFVQIFTRSGDIERACAVTNSVNCVGVAKFMSIYWMSWLFAWCSLCIFLRKAIDENSILLINSTLWPGQPYWYFSNLIQIAWKCQFAFDQIVDRIATKKFIHAATALPSWYVQTFLVI